MPKITFSEEIERARVVCGAFPRRPSDHDASLRRAAVGIVLVPLDDVSNDVGFVLTLRSSRLRAHSGQFALPGGRIDKGETAIDAVIRECSEELALHFGPTDILGVLDDYPTRSGYVITPIVLAKTNTQVLDPNPDEVAEVYVVPLSDITKEGAAQFVSIPESDRLVIRYPLLNSLIHAPAAAIFYQLAELLNGRVTRVHELEQPVFAWR